MPQCPCPRPLTHLIHLCHSPHSPHLTSPHHTPPHPHSCPCPCSCPCTCPCTSSPTSVLPRHPYSLGISSCITRGSSISSHPSIRSHLTRSRQPRSRQTRSSQIRSARSVPARSAPARSAQTRSVPLQPDPLQPDPSPTARYLPSDRRSPPLSPSRLRFASLLSARPLAARRRISVPQARRPHDHHDRPHDSPLVDLL